MKTFTVLLFPASRTGDYRQSTIRAEGRELADGDDGKDKVLDFEVNDEEVGRVPARPVVLWSSAPER